MAVLHLSIISLCLDEAQAATAWLLCCQTPRSRIPHTRRCSRVTRSYLQARREARRGVASPSVGFWSPQRRCFAYALMAATHFVAPPVAFVHLVDVDCAAGCSLRSRVQMSMMRCIAVRRRTGVRGIDAAG